MFNSKNVNLKWKKYELESVKKKLVNSFLITITYTVTHSDNATFNLFFFKR